MKAHGLVFKTRQLLFNFIPGTPFARCGFVVTRKTGNAVQRNKIKRWFREVFRLNKGGFAVPLDLVIVPRAPISSYQDIMRDFTFFTQWYNEKIASRFH